MILFIACCGSLYQRFNGYSAFGASLNEGPLMQRMPRQGVRSYLMSNIQTQSDGVVASSQGSAGQTSVFRIDLP